MRVVRDNVTVRVLEQTPEEFGFLQRTLRYETARGQARGRRAIPVYNVVADEFPAGLLPDVMRVAREAGVNVGITDMRAPMPELGTEAALACCGWLDESQREAVRMVARFGRGILRMATGAGKTEVFLAVAGALLPSMRGLFLAPRSILATQARERWALRFGNLDGTASGLPSSDSDTARVRFVTYQTVHRAWAQGGATREALEGYLRGVEFVVADECHTVGADTFYPVLQACTGARVRVGLSATPLARTDDRSVLAVAALGPVIHRFSATDAVASGRIVQPVIRMYRLSQHAMKAHPRESDPDRTCPRCKATGIEPCRDTCPTLALMSGVWARTYRELVTCSPVRNALVVALALQAPKPGLVFVRNDLEHARFLVDALAKAGLMVRLVDGTRSDKQRKRVVAELQRGEADVAVTTSVFEAGVDIPELRSVVNAGAGLSSIRAAQMLGRGVRSADGKAAAHMLDIMDEGEPSLARHARARRKAYEAEGFRVDVLAGDAASPPTLDLHNPG